MHRRRCLLACTMLAASLFCGCGQQLQTVFFEDFDNATLNQPPPAIPQKGAEVKLDNPNLARVQFFGGEINSRALKYDQPTGSFPQSVYFVASDASASYDDGFRVIWRGKYGKVNDAGMSLSLMSGHFNTAWTVIFKGEKVKVLESNQEVEIGSLPLDRAHTFMCTVFKSTGKYSLSIIGDGVNLSKEGTIQMSAFWNSSPVFLRLYSLDGKPNPQSQGDSFIIDEPTIVAIKKK